VEHLQHFGLTQDPFNNEPDLRFFFESASHRDAQRRVERGLRQHKGLTLLTGEGGMGKTLLARLILDSLEEEVFEATLLVMLPGAADATGILQRFARQLGCEEPAADRARLLAQIYEQLAIVREDGRHAVLMIDDAQVMTPTVFSELAGLLSLEYEDKRLLSMLFVGSNEMDELVQADPSIPPRIDVRVRLRPFDLENTAAYLAHRLASVSADASLLSPPVVEALYKLGGGRPRLLNTLADNALFEAYLAGRRFLEPIDIERAAADLGIASDGAAPESRPSIASPPSQEAGVAPQALVESTATGSPELSDPFAGDAKLQAEPSPALEPELEESATELVRAREPATALHEALEPALTFGRGGDASAGFDLGADSAASLDFESEAPAALDFESEPLASFDLDSAAPTSMEFESEADGSFDLGADVEAALGDFATTIPRSAAAAASTPAVGPGEPLEALELELKTRASQAPPSEELSFAVDADAAGTPMIELEEADLSPLGAGDLDVLEDAFVELIEE
jgi:type II secretory pathway predicted ATPase ExeA